MCSVAWRSSLRDYEPRSYLVPGVETPRYQRASLRDASQRAGDAGKKQVPRLRGTIRACESFGFARDDRVFLTREILMGSGEGSDDPR